LAVFAWVAFIPLVVYLTYTSKEAEHMDLYLQICSLQEKMTAEPSMLQFLQR
jgi:hypothetical protein